MRLLFEVLLWIWFLGCTITWKIGKYTLVDGMGVRSTEFFMLVLYTISVILSVLFHDFGKIVVLFVLSFWLIVQFFCHWYFTIFGASDKKIKGYNECFKNTIRIFPQSSRRIIPDLYHIVLHILIALNILLNVISFKNS